jgi:hypothetical protein
MAGDGLRFSAFALHYRIPRQAEAAVKAERSEPAGLP